jgi:hypothetical protein
MKHEFKVIPKEEVLDNRSNAYEFIDFDKQETLEETAEKYKINIIKSGRSHRVEYTQQIKIDFIAGAKWQQERSYNEEDIMFAYEQGARLALISQSPIALHKGEFPTPDEWFDKFKNK